MDPCDFPRRRRKAARNLALLLSISPICRQGPRARDWSLPLCLLGG